MGMTRQASLLRWVDAACRRFSAGPPVRSAPPPTIDVICSAVLDTRSAGMAVVPGRWLGRWLWLPTRWASPTRPDCRFDTISTTGEMVRYAGHDNRASSPGTIKTKKWR